MDVSTQELERAVAWLESRLAADGDLAAERSSSRADYFAHRPAGAADVPALRRHLEWFLCERFSASRGGTPIESFVHGEAQDDPQSPQEALAAVLGSLASVFEVTGILPGEGAWVRDLAGGGEYALLEPQASLAFETGDLLVGRIFQVGGHLHRLSSAAGLFRDERLNAAVREDLAQARSSRRGTLRLSQSDLERMFWGADAAPAPAVRAPDLSEALARARIVLAAGGLEEDACEAVFESLREAPKEPVTLLPGGGDTLGRVLERLAMESEVDLGAARAALLEVWSGYSRSLRPEPAPGDAPADAAARARAADVRAAMEAFDRGRAEGRDLEQLFRDLERDLGLEEDEPAEEDLAPDFPGVVQAMVEEYLWELERREGEAAARAQAGLRAFGTFGANVGVFENLTRRDLLLFAGIWLPEYGGLADERSAQAVLTALEGFCSWCTAQHDFDLRGEFDADLSQMHATLPRLISARPWFAPSAGPADGALWLVRVVDGTTLTLVDASGTELVARVNAELAARLRPDDWLRGRSAESGEFDVFCAYPPESARLRPGPEG